MQMYGSQTARKDCALDQLSLDHDWSPDFMRGHKALATNMLVVESSAASLALRSRGLAQQSRSERLVCVRVDAHDDGPYPEVERPTTTQPQHGKLHSTDPVLENQE